MSTQQNINPQNGLNENQKKLIRKLQWIIYPLFFVFIAVEILPEFIPSFKEKLGFVKTILGLIEKGIFLLLFLIFTWVLLGFILHELSKNRERVNYKNVILELKHKKSIVPFIVVLAVLVFAIFMNYLLFEPSVIIEGNELTNISLMEKAIFTFFYVLVHFLLVVFTIRAIRNPAYFILTNEGFFYEPSDVSVGFILWKDIATIKEDRLLANRGGFAGPTTIPALAISFKEPDKYNKKYNFFLQKLVEIGTKLIKYQTGGVGDMVINPIDFGENYPKVKELMFEHFEKNK